MDKFPVDSFHWVKMKESEKIDKYQDLAGELKKLGNLKMTMILVVVGALGKGIRRTGYQRKNRDHLNYNIVETV